VSILSFPIIVVVGTMAFVLAGAYFAVKIIAIAAWLIARITRFALHEVRDSLLFVAAVVRGVFMIPRVLLSVILGRWSAVRHFGQNLEVEIIRACRLGYQLIIGNLLEIFEVEATVQLDFDEDGGLIADEPKPEPKPGQSPSDFLAGRKPKKPHKVRAAAMAAAAPSRDKPRKRDEFDGYQVVGSLPTGGSGAKIYVADFSAEKRNALEKAGLEVPAQAVIKCFQLDEGSNLSQIVRESRALESAKRLGMVIEHGLDERRYFYVMPYVPGDSLSLVTQRMHAAAGAGGLDGKGVRQALGFISDLLVTLERFHEGGLWHKDVKPDNIIVRDGRAHLVDLGLVTPLGSAMTLTTHGTEYFRDPELVRQALRGAKVHEVDGARFDLYATGAVLYALVEDSFPAHGSLSRVSKRCPDSVQWVIRRAMADLDSRYSDASEMLADVQLLAMAEDAFAVKPAQLPSMGGEPVSRATLASAPADSFVGTSLPQGSRANESTPEHTPLPETVQPAVGTPPPVPHYQPGPATAAYAEQSARRMPPPVPSKAREHAINAAREAREALSQLRNTKWDARDARKRARKRMADARKQVASHTRQVIAASKPKAKRKRKQSKTARRFKGTPSWGGAFTIAALLAVGTFALLAAAVDQRGHHHVHVQASASPSQHRSSAEFGTPVQVISETVSYGKNSSSVTHYPSRPLFGEHTYTAQGAMSEARGNAMIHGYKQDGRKAQFPIDRKEGRVLWVSDYSKSFKSADDHEDIIRESLQEADYQLLDSNYQGVGSDIVIDWQARARTALGLYTPDQKSTRESVLSFLEENPELDAILWTGTVGEADQAQAYLFVQGGYSGKALAKTIKRLEAEKPGKKH